MCCSSFYGQMCLYVCTYVCLGSVLRASAPVDHHRRNVIRVWGRRRRRREGGHIYRRLRRRKEAQEKVLEAITDFAAAKRRRERGGEGGLLPPSLRKGRKLRFTASFSLRRRLSRLSSSPAPPPSHFHANTGEGRR